MFSSNVFMCLCRGVKMNCTNYYYKMNINNILQRDFYVLLMNLVHPLLQPDLVQQVDLIYRLFV